MNKIIKPTQPIMPSMEDYIKEISSIWENGVMTNNGEKVNKFKSKIIEYTHCENADLFVNGHSALVIALQALNLQGEVITSPFTFVSTTNAIVQNGLTPVFGDIDDTYNLSPDSIEELVTEKTCAIVTPHIFGIPCDVQKIENIAKKHNLKVIYDGAQAFGTKIHGTDISCFGDITMFSLHAIKIFNSIEGGLLTYKDENLHRTFELLRNFGISYGESGNDVELVGMNAKMNEFQAAMGIVNLPNIDDEIKKRKKIAQWYCEGLKDIPGIYTYNYQDNIDYNYAYFPIKVINEEYGISRDELWVKLKEIGIHTRKLYDKLTCDYKCYKDMEFMRKTENAEKVTEIALDLPIYGGLLKSDIDYIMDEIEKIRQ